MYTLIWWSDYMPWRREQTVIRERYVEPVERYVEPSVEPTQGRVVRREREVIEHERRAS
jgi:hypothetical protein